FGFLHIKPEYSLIEFMEDEQFWDRWQTTDIKNLIREFSKDSLSLFILIKLFYSALTAADYYATLEYMEAKEFSFELINEVKFKEIWNNFHCQRQFGNDLNFNVDIDQRRVELRSLSIDEIKYPNKFDALNELRSKINVEAEDRLEKILAEERSSNVYLLNVPTGGGKTNLSLRLALKIMERRNIRKMFYVFPFINIIEQSFDGLKKYIGTENMDRLDSRYIDPKEKDDVDPKTIYANYINNLFFNKPVLFLSHVKFFDLFFRNDKNSNYNFFQLANSVVIIDEIQAYDDQVWTEVTEVLNSFGIYLNTHFIVMSATLPQLQRLTENGQFASILMDEMVTQLFNHPLFKRTRIVPSKGIKKEKLAKEIIDQSAESNKVLAVLNTVKDSHSLYRELAKDKDKKLKGFDLLLLNSTIVEKRRQNILEECRKDKKIILISTQSIEAGVDIDFDIGFRAYAPIDSIVQVAGRVNRNSQKELCQLIVFKDDQFSKVYSSGAKAKISKEFCNQFFDQEEFDEYSQITDFYSEIIEQLRENNETEFLKSSRENIVDMRNLFFRNINESVHLIKGDTISLFIPYEEKAVELWKSYKQLFDKKGSIEKTAEIKAFGKKLTPYVVNLFNSYTKAGRLRNVLDSEIQYGYYCCDDWSEYFEYESGINVEKFKKRVAGNQAVFL
ncbi:CRISPR-associated helicase Cas3', partial [bacterium]|nr:CRISPR-associated helicase Cas3' [bacterium]